MSFLRVWKAKDHFPLSPSGKISAHFDILGMLVDNQKDEGVCVCVCVWRCRYHWLVRTRAGRWTLVFVIDIVFILSLCSSSLLQPFILLDLHSTTLWQRCSGSCPVCLSGRSGHARHGCFSLFWWTRVPLNDSFVTLKASNVVLHALLAHASVCCINGDSEAPHCCAAQFWAKWQGRRIGESFTGGVKGGIVCVSRVTGFKL